MSIINNIYDKTVGEVKRGVTNARGDNKKANEIVSGMNIPDSQMRAKKVLEEIKRLKAEREAAERSRRSIKVSDPIVRDSPRMRKDYVRSRLKSLVRGGNARDIAEGSIEKRSKTGAYDRMQRIQD